MADGRAAPLLGAQSSNGTSAGAGAGSGSGAGGGGRRTGAGTKKALGVTRVQQSNPYRDAISTPIPDVAIPIAGGRTLSSGRKTGLAGWFKGTFQHPRTSSTGFRDGRLESESERLLNTPKPLKLKKYHDTPPDDTGLISTPIAVSFNINFIMGVGFLGLPWAFAQAGIVLASVGLAILTVVCLITAGYILNTMRRAEALTRLQYKPAENQEAPTLIISNRKFELVEMVEMFLGRNTKLVYIVLVVLYLAGTGMSYATVFGSAFASHVPLPFLNDGNACGVTDATAGCRDLYRFWVLVFTVALVALSCLDLKEQAALQVTMTALRAVLILLMVTTVSMSLATGHDQFGSVSHAYPGDVSVSAFFRPMGLPLFLSLAVYSQLFHTAVPVLAQPVRHKKTILTRVFGSTYIVTFTVYTAAACVIALYFGRGVSQSCNVVWSQYTGGTSPTAGWASIISYCVVLFPAFDVLSVAPLNAIVLASNVMSAIYGDRTPKMERNRCLRMLFRVACAGLPCIGAAFVSGLDTVLNLTGIVGLLIAFVMPPLLDELSSRQCMLAWPTTAPKSSKVHVWTARGIAVFGVAATILGIVTSF